MNGFQKLISITLLSTVLAACGQAPIKGDQPVYLASGQGLAVVMFDSLDPLSDVVVVPSAGGGSKLEIPSVPVGKSMYLFAVPAGEYCFQSFLYGQVTFKDPTGKNGPCFSVPVATIGYSGTIAPRGAGGVVYLEGTIDVPAMRAYLRQWYPTVAKQFLTPDELTPAPLAGTAAAPSLAGVEPHNPPAAGSDQVSVWAEEVSGTRDQVLFFRNNTVYNIKIAHFELYDCVGIKQSCGAQNLDLTLAPSATKAAMLVEPATPNSAYTYNTRYNYEFVQSAPSAPPPQGVVQFWFQDDPTTHSRTVMVRNNTAQAVYVHKFELYDCHGVKQACGLQKLKLQLAPYASQAALVVDPVDPGGFSFKVRFAYGYAASGKP